MKTKSLSEAMQGLDRRSPASPAAAAASAKESAAKFRSGKRAITLYATPEGRRLLRTLVAELEVTQEQLLAEALNDLFLKYKKAPLA